MGKMKVREAEEEAGKEGRKKKMEGKKEEKSEGVKRDKNEEILLMRLIILWEKTFLIWNIEDILELWPWGAWVA